MGLFGTKEYPQLFEEGSLRSIIRKHRSGKKICFPEPSGDVGEKITALCRNVNMDPNDVSANNEYVPISGPTPIKVDAFLVESDEKKAPAEKALDVVLDGKG